MGYRPGGELAARPLHFIWIADASSSMRYEGKIQALNQAIREALPHMRDVARENPHAEVLVRAISFSSSARWHVDSPTGVEGFEWPDLQSSGYTAMGEALELLAEALDVEEMSSRALPPVLVLLSDGQPTDNFGAGLKALMDKPWARKAVRIAIAIGGDADRDVLQRFIGHPEIQPLEANHPEALVDHIRWASTAVLQAVSSPMSQLHGQSRGSGNVVLPSLPGSAGASQTKVDANDIW